MLAVAQLSYRYPGATANALDGVSLSAARGGILGLLGPNGAGKSTLVAHIAGLIPVTQGTIRVDALSLTDARRRDPTRIAVAPQDFAFYPALTVTENLACFAAANRLDGADARAAVTRCLALARLEAYAEVIAARLSGGYKRRLNLAIALLARPDLVVLDEPTVGVDPESRALLLDAVRALASEGAAVIYTSHYMEEIEAIADTVAILHHGRLLRHGALDELLAGEHGRMTITLATPLSDARTAQLTTQLAHLGTVQTHGTQLAIALAPGASPAAALTAIEASGHAIRDLHWGRTRLEHLFMRLTGEDACSPH